MESICISSLVVQTTPAVHGETCKRLCSLPGVSVLGENGCSKLAVLVDATSTRAAADRLESIRKLPGVLSATLIFQYDDSPGSPGR